MAQLLGDRFLPESVTSARQRLRSRVADLREPIRSRRVELMPGPDLVGRAEDQVMNLRTRFVRRESLLDRIRMQRGDDSNGETSKSNGDTDRMV